MRAINPCRIGHPIFWGFATVGDRPTVQKYRVIGLLKGVDKGFPVGFTTRTVAGDMVELIKRKVIHVTGHRVDKPLR